MGFGPAQLETRYAAAQENSKFRCLGRGGYGRHTMCARVSDEHSTPSGSNCVAISLWMWASRVDRCLPCLAGPKEERLVIRKIPRLHPRACSERLTSGGNDTLASCLTRLSLSGFHRPANDVAIRVPSASSTTSKAPVSCCTGAVTRATMNGRFVAERTNPSTTRREPAMSSTIPPSTTGLSYPRQHSLQTARSRN
jgi:hypothetical protein